MKNGAFLYTDLEISTYVCHAPSAFEVTSIWHYKSDYYYYCYYGYLAHKHKAAGMIILK